MGWCRWPELNRNPLAYKASAHAVCFSGRAILISCLALGLLAACAIDQPATSADVLPPVKEYSADFQAEFVEQYSEVPKGSALDLFVLDAVALRCAVRAARGDPVPDTCRGDE